MQRISNLGQPIRDPQRIECYNDFKEIPTQLGV
jgi:hypothetical protein